MLPMEQIHSCLLYTSNHYVSHEGCEEEQLEEFHAALYSVDTRLHMMYAKAKEDKTFRTDIPEEEFMRVTVHSMMTACAYSVSYTHLDVYKRQPSTRRYLHFT